MDRFGIELHLAQVADARDKWALAYAKFASDVDFVLARLFNEAATNMMSVEQIAKPLRMEPKRLRALMRTHRLNPSKGKRLLAKEAAETLAENAALLGIEPWEMDLMSPLAYLPMGSELRARLEEPEPEVSGNPWNVQPVGHKDDALFEVYDSKENFIATFNGEADAIAVCEMWNQR